jgi:hypothetical protein
MNDGDTRLELALKASDPAARDPMFRIEVMVRRARATARRQMLSAVGAALGVAVTAAVALGWIGAAAGLGVGSLAAIAGAGLALITLPILPYAGAVPVLRSLGARLVGRLPGFLP